MVEKQCSLYANFVHRNKISPLADFPRAPDRLVHRHGTRCTSPWHTDSADTPKGLVAFLPEYCRHREHGFGNVRQLLVLVHRHIT